jgi:fermentation-respiration switch protein FrsA (DUF1100 family)
MIESPFTLTVDGINLCGRSFSDSGPGPRPGVIILHGIPRDKTFDRDETYPQLARRLAQLGWLAILFNFRGTGESGGNFHLLGWDRDLTAVAQRAVQDLPLDPARLAVLGFSGGAAAAIYNAAHNSQIRAVVSVSAPAEFNFVEPDLQTWIKQFRAIGLFRDPGFPASIDQWENEFKEICPIRWVDRISPRPILFIHGTQDEIVPLEHARRLFEKAKDPKELSILEGSHRLKHSPLALERAISWLEAWKTNKLDKNKL